MQKMIMMMMPDFSSSSSFPINSLAFKTNTHLTASDFRSFAPANLHKAPIPTLKPSPFSLINLYSYKHLR